MEEYVQSLLDRLTNRPQDKGNMIAIMDSAINEMHNKCPDGVMNCYVHTDATGENYRDLRRNLLVVDNMYENYQIVVAPPSVIVPTPSPAPTPADPPKKKGLFSRLFGK